MLNFNFIRMTCATVALCALAASANAQYVWLDAKGMKQFSDVPPPASIPLKNILKAPSATREPVGTAPIIGDSTVNLNAAANAASTPVTTAEKNADFNKRKLAQAEKDRKVSDQAKADADSAKNCERARAYKRSLDSGERIVQMGKNDERGYMNEEQRAQEVRSVDTTIAGCKS